MTKPPKVKARENLKERERIKKEVGGTEETVQ